MPLKGKILNTWEVSSDEVLASQEVHDISVAIGIDPDSDDLSQLRYGKICILASTHSNGLPHCHAALRFVRKTFPRVGETRSRLRRTATALPY